MKLTHKYYRNRTFVVVTALCMISTVTSYVYMQHASLPAYVTDRSCEDSDNGITPETHGTVNWRYDGTEDSLDDYCASEKILIEFSCGIDNLVGDTEYTCEDSCHNGRCVSLIIPDEPQFSGLKDRYDLGETMNVTVKVRKDTGEGLRYENGWRMQYKFTKWGAVGIEEVTELTEANYISPGTWEIVTLPPQVTSNYFLSISVTCWDEDGCLSQQFGLSTSEEFRVGPEPQQVEPLDFIYRTSQSMPSKPREYYSPGDEIRLRVEVPLSDGTKASVANGWILSYTLQGLNGFYDPDNQIQGGSQWDVSIPVPEQEDLYFLSLRIACEPDRGCKSQRTSTVEDFEFYVTKSVSPQLQWEKPSTWTFDPREEVYLGIEGSTKEFGVLQQNEGWTVTYSIVPQDDTTADAAVVEGDGERLLGQKSWSLRFTTPVYPGKYTLMVELHCKEEHGCYKTKETTTLEQEFTVRGFLPVPDYDAAKQDAAKTITTIKESALRLSSSSSSSASFSSQPPILDSQNPFPDVDPTTLNGYAAVFLYNKGIIQGFPDGQFKGWNMVDRSQASKMLLKSIDVPIVNRTNNGQFTDVVAGQWYVPYVMKASELGIIYGDAGKRTFRPADGVNTAEFLAMLARAFDAPEYLQHGYTDVSPDSWYSKYAGIAWQYNLFPDREKRLSPDTPLMRSEVATALYLYMNR